MEISPTAGKRPIAIIGAGIGGLAAAIDLAVRGFEVCVYERAATPGGKMREIEVGGRPIDVGPTVLTLREIFDEIFAAAGARLDEHLRLRRAELLARHAWDAGARLDLYADPQRSIDAIGRFAGARDARGYRDFVEATRRTYAALERSFVRATRPSMLELIARIARRNLAQLFDVRPFADLYRSTGRYFSDPRLRQLFARYATYCGSSPFAAPATLQLIAHVELAGVWYVDGGMRRIADALASLAERRGALLRYQAEVRRIRVVRGRVDALELTDGERIEVAGVICNADQQALAAGAFGAEAARALGRIAWRERSLSAITWAGPARARGFPLAHHNVFFGGDYRAEFNALFGERRVPLDPTVYVCAQDRIDDGEPADPAGERLFCLVNAPPIGDLRSFGTEEIRQCELNMRNSIERCGLGLRRPCPPVVTTPTDFDRLFAGSGGALYGPVSHGWRASFRRPGARTALPGLYLAGGSAHPGAGVPMAAISGRLAAQAIMEDYVSTSRSRRAAIAGGISMR